MSTFDLRTTDLEAMPWGGVYAIEDSLHKKVWLAASSNIVKSWAQNLESLNESDHPVVDFQFDWDKSPGLFKFKVIITLPPESGVVVRHAALHEARQAYQRNYYTLYEENSND